MPSAFQPFAGPTVGDNSITPIKIASTFGGFLRNKIINGDFNIAQRNTSFSTPSNGAYTLDRWVVSYDGTIGAFTVSQQAHTVGQTDVPDEPIYFFRWNQTSAGSGSTLRRVSQKIENVQTLAGKAVTLTFYAKADSSRNVAISLIQNFGGSGSASVTVSGGTAALTTSWQKFTVNATLASISGKTVGTSPFLEIRLDLPINTTMTIDISHVQVEENGFTPFEQRLLSLEQALCERYYQIVPTAVGTANVSIPFKTSMRTTPTVAGGAAGFTTSNLSANGGSALQTAAANQTLTLDAEI